MVNKREILCNVLISLGCSVRGNNGAEVGCSHMQMTTTVCAQTPYVTLDSHEPEFESRSSLTLSHGKVPGRPRSSRAHSRKSRLAHDLGASVHTFAHSPVPFSHQVPSPPDFPQTFLPPWTLFRGGPTNPKTEPVNPCPAPRAPFSVDDSPAARCAQGLVSLPPWRQQFGWGKSVCIHLSFT